MIRPMVTSRVVLDKVKSTFNISHSNWVNFAVEEIGYGIQLIGYHTGFKEVAIDKCVINHVAQYPSHMIGFKHIEYQGRRLPLVEDKSMAKLARDVEDKKKKSYTVDFELAEELEKLIQAYNLLIEYELNNNVVKEEEKTELLNKIQKISLELNLSKEELDVNQHHGYYVNDDTIITTFSNGDIILYGTIIATDKEGYPMIRNEANYIEALFWWVTSKLMLQGYKNPNLGYGDALNLWNDYKHKASNNAKMSADKMENFKNMWTRYVHKTSFADNFMKGAERQSQL